MEQLIGDSNSDGMGSLKVAGGYPRIRKGLKD